MGKLLSGICCAIVGLEVLIGVPLAVCLSFVALTQGGSVVHEYHPAPLAATIPPPVFAGPAMPPVPVAPLPPGPPPYSLPEAAPIGSGYQVQYPGQDQVPKTEPSPKESSPADDVLTAAVVESRERIGSPLAGTTLAPPGTEPSSAEFVQSLRQLGEESTLRLPPQNPAATPPAPAAEPLADAALAALKQSAERLYQLAGRFEDEGKFGRADRLRCLARSVREELEEIGQESLPPAAEPPLALAPTAAPK
jgi:hypothetical protein